MHKKRKVVAFLNGGLGNQMFEYALALGVALRLNRELVLDTSAYWLHRFRRLNIYEFEGPRKKTLRVANVTWSLISMMVRIVAHCLPGKKTHDNIERKAYSFLGLENVSASSAWVYDSIFVNIDQYEVKDILIKGIYQFLPPLAPREMLQEDFKIVSQPNESSSAYLAMIGDSSTESVCVHVRRGDYTNLSMTLPIEYYSRAMNRLREERQNKKLRHFFFSDDPAWCSSTFSHVENAVFMTGNVENPIEDLRLMIACRHHIIANSTFSFWGAYLAETSKDAVTIAPDRWAPDFFTTDTMVPNDWILIPSFKGNDI